MKFKTTVLSSLALVIIFAFSASFAAKTESTAQKSQNTNNPEFAGCREDLPVDLYFKCLEKSGKIPRRIFSSNEKTLKNMADKLGCDRTADSTAIKKCISSYFQNNVTAATNSCDKYVDEAQVLDCLLSRGKFAPTVELKKPHEAPAAQ